MDRYQDQIFRWHTGSFEGFTAQIIQHEIDHCNGILEALHDDDGDCAIRKGLRIRMKKAIIMTDLEGISLVDTADMMTGDGYDYACRRLEADLNAAIAGCFDAGVDAVWYVDGHGGGKNIYPANIDPRAFQIIDFNDPGIFDDCIAYLETGLHAKAGTLNAFLDHTQSSATVHDYCINGVACGEFAQGAAYCGAYGVPFVMVSGDRAACGEAAALVPGIACAIVKEARGRNKAVCVDAREAEKRIREAACDGVERASQIGLWTIDCPAEIRFHFHHTWYCDNMVGTLPGWRRTDGRTVVKTIEKVVTYRDLNLC
ncbi:MAG: M55 family metallopeptidase [Clostridia bacterium]|nr:M55 family metallopeptidase [Clostridia bacterium]